MGSRPEEVSTAAPSPSAADYCRQAALLLSRGRPELALKCARRAGRAGRGLEGRALVGVGEVEEGVRVLRAQDAAAADVDVEAVRGLAAVVGGWEAVRLLRGVRGERGERKEVDEELAAWLVEVGVRCKVAGLESVAVECFKEALEVVPECAQAMYNMGVVCGDTGDVAAAERWYRSCLDVSPVLVEAWCNLGVLWRGQGKLTEAVEAYERALSVRPGFELAKINLAGVLCDLGTKLKQAGDGKGARRAYKKALSGFPECADAHYNLGVAYVEAGKLDRAVVSYNMAIQFKPDSAEAHNNLGVVYKTLGNLHMALTCYKNALRCEVSEKHQTHNNVAVVCTMLGDLEEAARHLRLANALCPTYAEAHNNIGVLLRDEGDIDAAIVHYEHCVRLNPRADMAAQNRLHALNYSEKWSKTQVFEEHTTWGAAFQARIDAEITAAAKGVSPEPIVRVLAERMACPPVPNPGIPRGPHTSRPLRVGYLSPDLFTHSVSYFTEALLAHHSPDCVISYVYANVAQPDAKTTRMRAYVGEGRWRNIWTMTAPAVAELIVKDEIDILVELAGHTANNRLDVMALRSAPVQVTWIGYPNSTGLSTIHYRVTDNVVDPVGTSQQFSERLWRLPDVFLCYTPSVDAPPNIGTPPAVNSGGIITFGSFNVLAKTQAQTIRLWATILLRVPNSRLLLKAKPFGAASARRRVVVLFEEAGISADRLDLMPLVAATRSHLQVYDSIDVALDPFPYAGTTTTCEAMYMGVPVVTLAVRPEAGDHAHNVGATLLTAVGHPELIAYSKDEYVDVAVALASDLPRLEKIRRNLRREMMDSPLGRASEFVENVEAMFCDMWVERGGRLAADEEANGSTPAFCLDTNCCNTDAESVGCTDAESDDEPETAGGSVASTESTVSAAVRPSGGADACGRTGGAVLKSRRSVNKVEVEAGAPKECVVGQTRTVSGGDN